MHIESEILISIVVTAYNVEQYIKECIDSIRNQTYKNIEVIIVNDGSTDDTEEQIIKAIEGQRGYSYYTQTNAGVSVARNRGIQIATGDYIMFVDGDDMLDHRIIEVLVSKLSFDIDIICCCCIAFNDSIRIEDHFFDHDYLMSTKESKERLFLQLMNGNAGKPNSTGFTAIGVPWGKLYKMSTLKKNDIWFEPELRRMQDNVFNMSAFYRANQILYIDEPLYKYRIDHITCRETLYHPDIWLRVLKERDAFFQRIEWPSRILEEAQNYEKHTALSGAALYCAKKMSIKEAIHMMKTLRNRSEFKPIMSFKLHPNISVKHRIVWSLFFFKLYVVLYFGLKLF